MDTLCDWQREVKPMACQEGDCCALSVHIKPKAVELDTSTMMRPDSAEVAFTKTCEGRYIEVVGASDIAAFDKVFFDNSQTNLQDLVLLGSNSGIIVEFLETQLASHTLSSASNTRKTRDRKQ